MALRLLSRSWLLTRQCPAATVCAVRHKTAVQIIHERQDKSIKWAEAILKEAEEKKQQKKDESKAEPHMLHVVWRLKTMRHRPWWEKEIMKKLSLDGPLHNPVVQKNIPAVNKQLKVVKHLVKILPLTFPQGLPEHESDYEHAFINTQGELILKKRLPEFEPDPTQKDERDKWRMELETVKKVMRRKKETFGVYSEYHDTSIIYKMNQDGREYRYNFNEIEAEEEKKTSLQ